MPLLLPSKLHNFNVFVTKLFFFIVSSFRRSHRKLVTQHCTWASFATVFDAVCVGAPACQHQCNGVASAHGCKSTWWVVFSANALSKIKGGCQTFGCVILIVA